MKFYEKYVVSRNKYELIVKLYNYAKQARDINLKLSQAFQNTQAILAEKKNFNLFSVYDIDEIPYGIFFERRKMNFDDELLVFTYNLLSVSSIVCRSDSEFSSSTFELVNIDTIGENMRKGHASMQVEFLKYFCKQNRIPYLYGMLWQDSPIGLDNLKRFYFKNGFIINNQRFKFNIDI